MLMVYGYFPYICPLGKMITLNTYHNYWKHSFDFTLFCSELFCSFSFFSVSTFSSFFILFLALSVLEGNFQWQSHGRENTHHFRTHTVCLSYFLLSTTLAVGNWELRFPIPAPSQRAPKCQLPGEMASTVSRQCEEGQCGKNWKLRRDEKLELKFAMLGRGTTALSTRV